MGGRGPVPKEERQRKRDTNRRTAGTTIVAADGQLRGPVFPKEWIPNPHPAALKWWDTWRRSAQAQMFTPTDWESLKKGALLVHRVWAGALDTPISAYSELRLIEEKFGATYVDRMRAKVTIPFDRPEEQEKPVAKTTSKADMKARMGQN